MFHQGHLDSFRSDIAANSPVFSTMRSKVSEPCRSAHDAPSIPLRFACCSDESYIWHPVFYLRMGGPGAITNVACPLSRSQVWWIVTIPTTSLSPPNTKHTGAKWHHSTWGIYGTVEFKTAEIHHQWLQVYISSHPLYENEYEHRTEFQR